MKLVCFDRKFYDFVCFVGVFRFKLSEIKPGNTYLRSTDPTRRIDRSSPEIDRSTSPGSTDLLHGSTALHNQDRPISYMDRPFCFFRIDRSLPDRDTCLKII